MSKIVACPKCGTWSYTVTYTVGDGGRETLKRQCSCGYFWHEPCRDAVDRLEEPDEGSRRYLTLVAGVRALAVDLREEAQEWRSWRPKARLPTNEARAMQCDAIVRDVDALVSDAPEVPRG